MQFGGILLANTNGPKASESMKTKACS